MSYTTTEKTAEAKKGPIDEIRVNGCKVTVWENKTDKGVRHNVTIQRIYRDGEQWKTSDSFGRDDLPLVIKVADLAHTWIFHNVHPENGQQSSGQQEHDLPY